MPNEATPEAVSTPPALRGALEATMNGGSTGRGLRLAVRAAVAAALATAITACAPDAWKSNQATGFNGYLKTLGQVCQPLQIGTADVGQWIQLNDMSNDNYTYFVDVTSKLYYNRLTQAGYRQAVTGFFGPGSPNERSFDCIFRNLPPDRPSAPVGTY